MHTIASRDIDHGTHVLPLFRRAQPVHADNGPTGVPHDHVDFVPVCIAKESHDGDKILHIIGEPGIPASTTTLVVAPASSSTMRGSVSTIPSHYTNRKSKRKESSGKRRAARLWKR